MDCVVTSVNKVGLGGGAPGPEEERDHLGNVLQVSETEETEEEDHMDLHVPCHPTPSPASNPWFVYLS